MQDHITESRRDIPQFNREHARTKMQEALDALLNYDWGVPTAAFAEEEVKQGEQDLVKDEGLLRSDQSQLGQARFKQDVVRDNVRISRSQIRLSKARITFGKCVLTNNLPVTTP
jgi:hypothetical protein